MSAQKKQPFIPRDKPKSWVLGVLSGLVGLIVAGPMMFAGGYFDLGLVKGIGITMFVICWLTFATSWLVFVVRMLKGKYRDIQDREWCDQLW